MEMTLTFHSRDISDKLLYTATEACQIIFGDSKKSTMNRMYRMLNDGAIDAERVGGTWFISRKTLVELYGRENTL